MIPIALTAPELLTALDMNIAQKSPTMTWGPFGIAKSALHRQFAESRGMVLKDVRAMLLNPIDVNGLPHIVMPGTPAAIIAELQRRKDDPTFTVADMISVLKGDDAALSHYGQTVWSRPGILPAYDDSGRRILILFDEINSASPDVQAALYQPVLDRRIGDHLLDNGVAIAAAGNRSGDKGVVKPMPMPLSDRFQHYDLIVALEPWLEWAAANDIHPLVIAYMKMADREYPADDELSGCGMLHRFNPKNADRSVPTPRSWERVSHMLKEIEDRNLQGTKLEVATIAGKVGREAANSMIDFMQTAREGLTVDGILMNPDTAPVARNSAMQCAVIAAMARRITLQNSDRVCQYVERHVEEYQIMFLKLAAREHPEIENDKVITKLKYKHKEAIG